MVWVIGQVDKVVMTTSVVTMGTTAPGTTVAGVEVDRLR